MAPSVQIDFCTDVQQQFIQALRADGYADVESALTDAKQEHLDKQKGQGTAHPLNEPHWILMQWYKARMRRISAVPRKAHRSKELVSNSTLTQQQLTAVAQIESDCVAGTNLTPRLSRFLKDLEYDDLMLNEWGLHHMHLGDVVEADGFISRTRPLLFVMVTPSSLYLLNVLNHGGWTDTSLLEIVLANWPHLIGPYRMRGVLGLAQKITDKERLLLRKSHVTTFIELSDGGVYGPPGGGFATSGTSINAVRWGDRFLSCVDDLEENVKAQAESMRDAIAEATKQPALDVLNFRLVIDEKAGVMQVVETRTAVARSPHIPFP